MTLHSHKERTSSLAISELQEPSYLIYVEKYNWRRGFLLLDFVLQEDCQRFCAHYQRSQEQTLTSPSTLMLVNTKIPATRSIREGQVYRVPHRALYGMDWHFPSPQDEETILARVHAASLPATFFENTVATTEVEEECTYSISSTLTDHARIQEMLDASFSPEKGPLSVIVKQVDQGSWNEIRAGDCLTAIFDFGCSIHWSATRCKNAVSSLSLQDHPILIISHWDIDHYKLLEAVSDAQLRQLNCAILPHTCISATSKRMAKRLEFLCPNVVAVPPAPKTSRFIGMDVLFQGGHYMLQVGHNSANVNLSGLALTLWGSHGCVFLCADHSYSQLFQHMKPKFLSIPKTFWDKRKLLNCTPLPCHMVVPHHGGHAGAIKATYSLANSSIQPGLAVISTGPNYYGHPFPWVETALSGLGLQVTRVDILGRDVSLNL